MPISLNSVPAFVLLQAVTLTGVTFANIDIGQLNVNDVQSQLTSQLANSNFSLEDARTLLRDKCIQVAGEEKGTAAHTEIEEATTGLADCIQGILNFTAIQEEIDEASPRGELDVVFNKYCNKRPEVLECVEAFNSKLEPCLDKEEREHQDVFMRIVRSLLNFVCHKGGDQIALFIAEKGPECLDSKKDDIQECINSTLSGYMPKEGFNNVKSLPKFVMGPKQCDEMERLEECIVKKLEHCAEITPANIVESMFRFIKNETICRNTGSTSNAKQASSNASQLPSLSGVVLALLCLFFTVLRLFQLKA